MLVLIPWLLFPNLAVAERKLPNVITQGITFNEIDYRIRTFGVLSPKTEELSFKQKGRVKEFLVEEGEMVKTGQLLATLETEDAEFQVKNSKVELAQAQRKMDRMSELFTRQAIQASQLEDVRDVLQKATINLAQAREKFDRCFLKAPSNGVILAEVISTTTTVTAGQPLFIFQSDDEPWIALIRLSDNNAFSLTEGASADISFAPYPGQSFSGKLSKMAKIASSKDGLYTAEITIETGEIPLRPGMIAEVNLAQKSRNKHYIVPLDSLVDMRRNQATIYLLGPASTKAVERKVTVYAITGVDVALVDSLEGFDRVIVRGQTRLHDNDQVRVLD